MKKNISKLDAFMDGAITERFNQELSNVLRNAMDPNTDAKAKRTLTIKIDVTPNESRTLAKFAVAVTSKLAASKPFAQDAFIREDEDGNFTATEVTMQVPGQIDMDGEEQPLPNVLNFAAKA